MDSEHLAGCSSLTTDGMLQQLDKMLWNHENSYLYEEQNMSECISKGKSDDTLDRLRRGVDNLLNEYVVNAKEDVNSTQAGIVQCYILLQILDMLDNINEKLAMTNINIQDVEQEVSKLNPRYTG